MQQDRTQVPLLQSALWFIGEYGDLLAESYDDDASVKRRVGKKKEVLLKPVHYDSVEWSKLLAVLTSIADDNAVSNESRMMLLTALLKLSDRFGSEVIPDVKALLSKWRDSTDIELQQRANEYFVLLGEDEQQVLEPLLEQMPPLDIDTAKMLRKENELKEEGSEEEEYESSEEESEEEESDGEDAYADLLGLNDSPKPSSPKPELSFSDLLNGASVESSAEPSAGTVNDAAAVTGTEPSAVTATVTGTVTATETAAEPSAETKSEMTVTAFDRYGITVAFREKTGASRGEIIIKVTVTNGNAVDAEGLSLQLSVPRYIQLQMKPLSADVVPANGQGACSQLFRVRNNAIDEKNTVVKLRVVCQIGEKAVDEVVLVDQFIGNECRVCCKQRIAQAHQETVRRSSGCSSCCSIHTRSWQCPRSAPERSPQRRSPPPSRTPPVRRSSTAAANCRASRSTRSRRPPAAASYAPPAAPRLQAGPATTHLSFQSPPPPSASSFPSLCSSPAACTALAALPPRAAAAMNSTPAPALTCPRAARTRPSTSDFPSASVHPPRLQPVPPCGARPSKPQRRRASLPSRSRCTANWT